MSKSELEMNESLSQHARKAVAAANCALDTNYEVADLSMMAFFHDDGTITWRVGIGTLVSSGTTPGAALATFSLRFLSKTVAR